MTYCFKPAETEAEFEQISRLNHQVFAEEAGQYPASAASVLVDKFHHKNQYVIAVALLEGTVRPSRCGLLTRSVAQLHAAMKMCRSVFASGRCGSTMNNARIELSRLACWKGQRMVRSWIR